MYNLKRPFWQILHFISVQISAGLVTNDNVLYDDANVTLTLAHSTLLYV